MLSVILLVTFVFCLGVAVAAVLVSRQLVTTFDTELHKQLFYYLVAFYAFAFYGIWGQILTRALLAWLDTDAAAVEAVAAFVPLLGVPFLVMSWVMLINLGHTIVGRVPGRGWLFFHAGVFLLLVLGSWLAVRVLGTPGRYLDANLGIVEAAGMTGAELVYLAALLAIVLGAPAGDDRRKVLSRFSLLLGAAFLARSVLSTVVLIDVRLAGLALLAYFGSNLGPLFYLRAVSDSVFKPVKAEVATPRGIEQVLAHHGITRRERQVVEKICLGKTNKQIADELFISLQTVKDHTHRIYSKLGVKSRMQLVQTMDAAK
jgi:DNA-binding CsgD family transcriptional regulator